MTDKQIIIDEKCPISEKCKEFENCKIQNILQQLKKRENKWAEEVEEKLIIQSQNEQLEMKNINLNEQLKGKEQECEELNNKYNACFQAVKEYQAENEELKGLNTGLVHLLEFEFNRMIKLRMCLQEIKEVAKELLQTKIPFCTIHEKIMEIINEVEQ